METATTPDTTGFDPAQLIEKYQVGVWRYLRALGCEPALADDLTQETFLSVLQHPFTDFGPRNDCGLPAQSRPQPVYFRAAEGGQGNRGREH